MVLSQGEIESLLDKRARHLREGDTELAIVVRSYLLDHGVRVEDVEGGQSWYRLRWYERLFSRFAP